MKKKVYFLNLLFICVAFSSCIEEFNFEADNNTKHLLVVNATITDEYKNQTITLNKTYSLKDTVPSFEENAIVEIIDNNNTVYPFKEISPGKYQSINKFKAETSLKYHLNISTKDGKKYTSETSELTGTKKMDSLYAEINTENPLGEGISIYVDSYDKSGKSKYYRYEYEATSKIVPPYWYIDTLKTKYLSVRQCYEFTIVEKDSDDRICYKLEKSDKIIQTSSTNLSEDRISKFQVNFIPKKNYYYLIYGYSILVKQYVQSFEAHTYYKDLNKFSTSETVFSQVQPGYLKGNISSITNINEKVIGFFEVSSISSKRLFFDYKDKFPNQPFPKAPFPCYFIAPLECLPTTGTDKPRSPLATAIESREWTFFGENNGEADGGNYLMVPIDCGDCRTQGSNIKPDFWTYN